MFAFSVKRFSVTEIIQLTPTIYIYMTKERLVDPRTM